MATTQLPDPQIYETVDLSHLAVLGIDQYQEIAYIYLNKQVFRSHIESLYVDSATKVEDYRKLLSKEDCVSIIIDLSILIERHGYDAAKSEKTMEHALAHIVYENVLEVGYIKPVIEFNRPVSEYRAHHRTVVAALLCDFMTDIVALAGADLAHHGSHAAVESPSELVLPSSSPAPAKASPAISLGEYARRKKEIAGAELGKHPEKPREQAVKQAGGLDARPQKRQKLAEEKGTGELDVSRWAGQAAF